jgi:hypothetical protein
MDQKITVNGNTYEMEYAGCGFAMEVMAPLYWMANNENKIDRDQLKDMAVEYIEHKSVLLMAHAIAHEIALCNIPKKDDGSIHGSDFDIQVAGQDGTLTVFEEITSGTMMAVCMDEGAVLCQPARVEKEFMIVWGAGYMSDTDTHAKYEIHTQDWFTETLGFSADDMVRMELLALAESMRLDDLHVVTVTRIK